MSNVSPDRPVTAAARRQSWRELPVRSWLLVTLGVGVVAVAVGVQGCRQGLSSRRLARSGVVVEATIESIAGGRRVDRSVEREVTMSYLLPGETERRVIEKTRLAPVQNATLVWGGTIPLRVDPKRPADWTDRVDPTPWLTTLAVPLLLAPIAALLAALTARERGRFLRLFARGAARDATVVDVHKSALVPGGKVVKLSLVGGDGRLFTATHPDALGAPAHGERVGAIVDHAGQPRRVIVARAYGETNDQVPMTNKEPMSES